MWRISHADPNKECSFEIKRIKAKNLRKVITRWGQAIIDEYNESMMLLCDCCALVYKPFCYDCRKIRSPPISKKNCTKHIHEKHKYVTDETLHARAACNCCDHAALNFIPNAYPYNLFNPIIYPYNTQQMFNILNDYTTTYEYVHRFFVFEGHKDLDTLEFTVIEH